LKGKVLLSLILIVVAGLTVTGYALATPSAGFYERDGDVFDDWEVSRTRAFEPGPLAKTVFTRYLRPLSDRLSPLRAWEKILT